MEITLDWESERMVTYEFAYVDGQITPATATPIARLQRFADGAWTNISAARVDPATGRFSLQVLPHTRGALRLRARSSGGSVLSNEVLVTVVPHTTEVRYTRSYPDPVTAKQWATVTGQVIEPAATPRVVVQRLVDGKWSDRQAGLVNQKTGFFSIPIRPTLPGIYTLRVRTDRGSRWSEPFTLQVDPAPSP